jgi:hypothetical protein
MELYYFGHFIDHLLSLEEICLSTSNTIKWKTFHSYGKHCALICCSIIPGGFFRSASIDCTHLLKMGAHEHVLWRSFSTLELENLLN